jgi:crotonobetainyl-CoA:carnitine CoA-transferase CaiB-like acyl-CoA transferase
LLLQQAGIPAHQAAGTEDFMADPQLAARGHFVKLDHPLMGRATVEATRYQLSGTPATYVRSAPIYGRDNAHVLRDLLGYDDARIARLDEAGALA